MYTGQAPFIEARHSDDFYKYISRCEYSKYWKKIEKHFVAQELNLEIETEFKQLFISMVNTD